MNVVEGLGFGVQGLGCVDVCGSLEGICRLGSMVWGLGFRVCYVDPLGDCVLQGFRI